MRGVEKAFGHKIVASRALRIRLGRPRVESLRLMGASRRRETSRGAGGVIEVGARSEVVVVFVGMAHVAEAVGVLWLKSVEVVVVVRMRVQVRMMTVMDEATWWGLMRVTVELRLGLRVVALILVMWGVVL